MKKNSQKALKRVGIGAGIVAATAGAAAGYYFYASKNAARNRKVAAQWAKGFKNDVVREAKKLKQLNRASVARVVDEIGKTYENVRGLDKKDLGNAVKELKANWQHLERELRSVKDTVTKAKSGVKKTAKRKKASR